jgi:hypothetical protein
MRKILILALALVLLAGCKKPSNKGAKNNPTPAPAATGDQTTAHAPTGVVVNPGLGGGGSGGAVQAVRMATKRAVSQNDLNQIHLFIENASAASGQMPTVQEISAALQKEAPQIYKQVQDKAIILTGTRSRENIWAWTYEPQSVTGEHLIVSSSGVQRMTAQELTQRLKQQQGQ